MCISALSGPQARIQRTSPGGLLVFKVPPADVILASREMVLVCCRAEGDANGAPAREKHLGVHHARAQRIDLAHRTRMSTS